MKFPLSFMMLAGSALVALPAAAQTAPHAGHQTAPQTTPAPTASATPDATSTTTTTTTTTTATAITEAEVQQFARAALDVEGIRADASIPEADKNARYVAAIQASGLKAARFNEIATAMQSDPALNQRIQTAGAALQGSESASAGTNADTGTANAAGTATPDE